MSYPEFFPKFKKNEIELCEKFSPLEKSARPSFHQSQKTDKK